MTRTDIQTITYHSSLITSMPNSNTFGTITHVGIIHCADTNLRSHLAVVTEYEGIEFEYRCPLPGTNWACISENAKGKVHAESPHGHILSVIRESL